MGETINKKYNYWVFALILFGMFFNHSNIISGVNTSLADPLLICIFIMIIVKKQLSLPVKPLIFFILLSIIILTATTIINNCYLNSTIQIEGIFKEYIKLLILFIYFVIGFNLARVDFINTVLKGFSIGTILLGIVSLIYLIIPLELFRDLFFFGETRFRGLMNDPNYFSVLQLCGIMFFLTEDKLKIQYKLVAVSILIISILSSGSKGGLISLIAMLFFFFSREQLFKKNRISDLLKIMVFLVISLLLFKILVEVNFLEYFADLSPSFSRIALVFNDFGEAINSGGSSRGDALGQALYLIKLSPVLGIGIGTYSSMNYLVSGERTLAHNTYLQLAAEWGLAMTLLFIIGVLIVFILSTKKNEKNVRMLNNMIIPFFLGSMSLSLNNARMFWFLLGAIFFSFLTKKEKVNE